MQLPHPGRPVGDPSSRQHLATLVEQAQVMAALAPIHPNEQHGCPPLVDILSLSQRRTCGALMAVLTGTTSPPAVRPPQHRPGHRLPPELAGSKASECSPASGSAVASHRGSCGPIRCPPPRPPPSFSVSLMCPVSVPSKVHSARQGRS